MTRIHRGKLQIIRDVLYNIQHTPTTTHLVYRANTTNKFINRYLPHLEKQGIIIRIRKSKGYRNYLTDKGRVLIKEFRLIDGLLKLEALEKEKKE